MSEFFPRRFFPGRRSNQQPAQSVDMGVTMSRVVEQKPCEPAKVIDAEGELVQELGCGEVYQLQPCDIPPCAPAKVIDAEGELVQELGCGEVYQLQPCPCAPAAVGWLIQPTAAGTYLQTDEDGVARERHGWDTPPILHAYIEDADGRNDTNEGGRVAIMRLVSLPWEGYSEHEPYPIPDETWLFLAAPFGDACGIRWDWEWDISEDIPEEQGTPPVPDWWSGYEIEQVGQHLQVLIKHGETHWALGPAWEAVLTAKAYCGDTEVGELILIITIDKVEY